MIVVHVAIMAVALAGWLSGRGAFLYAALGGWLLFILMPGILSRIYHQRSLQQDYAAACRLAKIIYVLHPTAGWRRQPEVIRALMLAQQGAFEAANEMIERLRPVKSLAAFTAVTQLYRATGEWEEFLAWESENSAELRSYPSFLSAMLRARGETGDLRGMAELYAANKGQIAKLTPASSRDICRLMLFAFSGQRESVAFLVNGSLAMLPEPMREFWLATVEMNCGMRDAARARLEKLAVTADPVQRRAIERRLAGLSLPPPFPDASLQGVVREASVEHQHDQQFAGGRSLFSKTARATQFIIAVNVIVFVGEMAMGGSTDSDTLYRMGALFAPAVAQGEWWRLLASMFLHAGPLHLAMNMFALWVLGPFVEFAFGSRKYLLLYLVAGIGSMGCVLAMAWPNGQQLTVGASGSIMGLIGGTAAFMLRGWQRHKALAARRRLAAMVLVVAMQTMFDAMVPEVSMTAHLSGVVIGFAVGLVLPNRLRTAAA
jgi:rhomboid protease GluP